MVLRGMRIRPFNLYKALGTDWLIATPGFVEVRRIVEEADRTLGCVLVQENLKSLAVDIGVLGKLNFLGCHVGL